MRPRISETKDASLEQLRRKPRSSLSGNVRSHKPVQNLGKIPGDVRRCPHGFPALCKRQTTLPTRPSPGRPRRGYASQAPARDRPSWTNSRGRRCAPSRHLDVSCPCSSGIEVAAAGTAPGKPISNTSRYISRFFLASVPSAPRGLLASPPGLSLWPWSLPRIRRVLSGTLPNPQGLGLHRPAPDR